MYFWAQLYDCIVGQTPWSAADPLVGFSRPTNIGFGCAYADLRRRTSSAGCSVSPNSATRGSRADQGVCPTKPIRLCIIACLAALSLSASEHHGRVMFNGFPVPGASVDAERDGHHFDTITDQQGAYSFPDLADGTWNIEVHMFGFAQLEQTIKVATDAPAAEWQMKLLPLDQIRAKLQTPLKPAPVANATVRPANIREPQQSPNDDELATQAADGFLINGTRNNSAPLPFSLPAAFGNNRFGGRNLYNGGIGIIFNNSALDARPFSLTGQDTPKAAYNQMTAVVTLGGPLKIPDLFTNGPNFFIGYQWTRNNNATTGTGLVPDALQRNGIFSTPIIDPLTGSPFAGNVIPQSRISPQAQALLSLYPLPNFDTSARYNYQVPLLSPTHQDALQSRLMKALNSNNQVYGGFAFQNLRADNPNLFGFLDTTDTLGMNATVNWAHRLSQEWFLNLGYQFSRWAAHVNSNFENRQDISGDARISGSNQDPMNWGPPSLVFSSGIAGLSDAQASFDRNQTSGISYSMMWNRGSHNITFGTDFRRREFNDLGQQDPRGTFTFTGAATGSAFADFLLGTPAAASIAYGNADKYFRESLYDAYFTDDWRLRPGLSVNAGVRWECGAPITELYGRLVDLDIVPGFTAAAPVVATSPLGALTGLHYPSSLVNPDKNGFEPRIGIAWKPVAGSSMVVRAGYGVYRDTSVYQNLAAQMAQQPPLSKNISAQNSAATPLTLANGFNAPSANTFAIDPNFRVGYAQNWQVSLQRDLPWSMQLTGTYLGIKGTRGLQEFLPNTYPLGAVNPCPACPTDFAYVASNGNSTREAAQLQLRRRLHSGFTATVNYTFSKSIDDDSLVGGQGGSQNSGGQNPSAPANSSIAIAQNWRDLSAERSLSSFDQRHLLSVQGQYTSGVGLGGGTLLSGWKGRLFKDWTASVQVNAGSGLPETPIYLAPVTGTAITGTIRPDYTGAPLYAAPAGLFLNPAAYAAPASGQWGNAGRNSITGPAQFTLNASLARTFRVSDRLSLDLRFDSTNALNHVNFTAWNTAVNSAIFGLPEAANAMRAIQTTLRLRF